MAHDKAALVVFGLGVGLSAGVFEELGWTGFAIPHLRRRFGVLATGLIVGLLWAAWHVLVVVWGIGNQAEPLPVALFVVLNGLTFLPAYRVLMVWIYDRTDSILVGILMHVSLTACTLILWPQTTGVSSIGYDAAMAVALWIVVAAIAMGSRAHPAQFVQRAIRLPHLPY